MRVAVDLEIFRIFLWVTLAGFNREMSVAARFRNLLFWPLVRQRRIASTQRLFKILFLSAIRGRDP